MPQMREALKFDENLPHLTVIVPARDEAENIGRCLSGAPVLRGHKLVYLSRAALETRYAPAAMLRCRGC